MATELWPSVEDLAKQRGVAKESVYRWIESRSLPAHKVGRLWKFKLSEVDAWVRAAAPTMALTRGGLDENGRSGERLYHLAPGDDEPRHVVEHEGGTQAPLRCCPTALVSRP